MEDIDLSRPGSELFPEAMDTYQQQDQVGDPLDTGVTQPEVAAHRHESDQQMNFKAVREELAKMQQEREYWKGQADAYARSPVRAEPQPAEQYNPFKDSEDDDWVKTSNVRDAYNALRAEFNDKMAAMESKAQHSDWNSMVTQHVPQLTSKNPIFAEMIQRTSNPYEAAYLLAQLNAQASQSTAPPPMSDNAQRAMTNAQKPVSVASMGGRGSLSSAEKYASMSDKDFMEFAAKNMAGI